MSGQSTRQIAAWLDPPCSSVAVSRFSRKYVQPALANAEKLESVIPEGLKEKHKAGVSMSGKQASQCPEVYQTASDAAKALTKQAILSAPLLHLRDQRIRLNQELTARMLSVINERAEDMSVCEACRRPEDAHPWEDPETGRRCDEYRKVPGGQTGLVIRKLKATGYEYAVDTPLLAEIREHQKQVAIDLGQWQENSSGAVSIQIVMPTAKQSAAGDLPRVEYNAQPLALQAATPEEDEYEVGIVQR